MTVDGSVQAAPLLRLINDGGKHIVDLSFES